MIIAVEDNGVGIPSNLQERFSEPFMTGHGGGLGLGLSIVQTIVEGLQGSIEVSRRGLSIPSLAGQEKLNGVQIPKTSEGSRFEVRIPQIRSIKPIAPKQPSQLDGDSSAQPSTGRRVLIIDDEEMILRSLKATLVGHEVATASDAYQGLELLCGQRFDFILCDLIMPRLSGLDLIDLSRTRNPAMEVRFVLTSGGIPSEDLCKRLEASDIEFMQNPFTAAELCEMISSTPQIETDSTRSFRHARQDST